MYSKEVWDEVIRLHIEEDRTYKSLSEEFGMNPVTISKRVVKFRSQSQKDAMKAKSLEDMEEIRRLRKELAETKKENDFLKNWRRSMRRRSSKVSDHFP